MSVFRHESPGSLLLCKRLGVLDLAIDLRDALDAARAVEADDHLAVVVQVAMQQHWADIGQPAVEQRHDARRLFGRDGLGEEQGLVALDEGVGAVQDRVARVRRPDDGPVTLVGHCALVVGAQGAAAGAHAAVAAMRRTPRSSHRARASPW